MVVLEDGGMMSTGNQYLQLDYLSPLPTTLDAKKSPLALLAQTCSQIGADNGPNKPLLPPVDKKKQVNVVNNSDSVSRTSPSSMGKAEKSRSPDTKHLAFKPYEANVISKKPEERPSSKASVDSSEEKKSGKSTPGRKSSPGATDNGKTSPSRDQKSSSPAGSSGTSPIIRSGLEVLGHGKDHLAAFKHANIPGLPGFNPLAGLCCPPGMEQHTNPAFRPPFAGAAFSAHHAAMLAAAGFHGAVPSAYLSYARVKTPSGGETLVPVCKDPYCTGCQFSLHNQQMLMGNGPCPSGCTQCDHHKYNLAVAMALSQQGGAPQNMPYSQLSRPYVCNWIAGEAYCGKRFGNSEELLQHLRSHTADGTTPPASSAVSQPSLLSPLNPLFTTAGLRGAYPTAAPLSPLSASRFHPYSKAGLPAGLGSSPYGAFNPALGAFYSPYVYGQRLGAAAVHQ